VIRWICLSCGGGVWIAYMCIGLWCGGDGMWLNTMFWVDHKRTCYSAEGTGLRVYWLRCPWMFLDDTSVGDRNFHFVILQVLLYYFPVYRLSPALS
jgi:hypothetical protein